MSGKWHEVSNEAKERFLIMQDRASAMLGYAADAPADKQHCVYLLMRVDGKKFAYDNAKPSAEEAIQEAWQYYIEASKHGAEWIQGQGLNHDLA